MRPDQAWKRCKRALAESEDVESKICSLSRIKKLPAKLAVECNGHGSRDECPIRAALTAYDGEDGEHCLESCPGSLCNNGE